MDGYISNIQYFRSLILEAGAVARTVAVEQKGPGFISWPVLHCMKAAHSPCACTSSIWVLHCTLVQIHLLQVGNKKTVRLWSTQ